MATETSVDPIAEAREHPEGQAVITPDLTRFDHGHLYADEVDTLVGKRPNKALAAALRKQFRIHGGVTEDAIADAVAEVLAPTVARWTPMDDPHLARCVCDIAHGVPPLEPAARKAVVEQFTAALLTGLDELERHNGDGTCIGAGEVCDVADLVHKVALEVGR